MDTEKYYEEKVLGITFQFPKGKYGIYSIVWRILLGVLMGALILGSLAVALWELRDLSFPLILGYLLLIVVFVGIYFFIAAMMALDRLDRRICAGSKEQR